MQQLELQTAAMGLNTPPHIAMEIENIRDQIKQMQIGSRDIISVELLQRMEPAERWKRLYDAIWEIEQVIYTLQKNAEQSRDHLQARHKEFNTEIQRIGFENELLRRSYTRLSLAAWGTSGFVGLALLGGLLVALRKRG